MSGPANPRTAAQEHLHYHDVLTVQHRAALQGHQLEPQTPAGLERHEWRAPRQALDMHGFPIPAKA